MEKEGVWGDPENLLTVFRCTTQKYANNFLAKGEIKFNTPNSWVKYAYEKGEGRGDKFEGTMAIAHKLDIEKVIELNEKYKRYPDLLRISIDDHVYLKRARDMELPCFCFYILKQSMIECPQVEGKQKLTGNIPASYFRDFMDKLDPDEVDKLHEEDRPAVICIENYEKFKQRIIMALMEIGLKREEIIITRVLYIDFEEHGEYGWWDFGQKTPKQLAIKDKRFESQSEARIIINTDDIKIKKTLEKPIRIGSLEDIASVSHEYLYEGMHIDLNCDIELLDE